MFILEHLAQVLSPNALLQAQPPLLFHNHPTKPSHQ
jgi:hypothetical protein